MPRFRALAISALIALRGLAPPAEALAQQAEAAIEVGDVQRAVPEDHTLSTVAVQVGKKRGSGFFVDLDSKTYLVTAKHVVVNKVSGKLYGPSMSLRYWSHPKGGSKPGAMSLDLKDAKKAKRLLVHNHFDVLAVRVGVVTVRTSLQLDSYVSGSGSLIMTAREFLLPFENVAIGNEVYIYGYPTAIGLKNVPQIDFTRPLLRRGAIAGINADLRTIILDVAVHGGNSGGPVWQVERSWAEMKFRVVGVVIEKVPLAQPKDLDNSGYAVAVPIDVVIEMIDSAAGRTRP